jgi:hypothetical protein
MTELREQADLATQVRDEVRTWLAERVCPGFRGRLQCLPWIGRRRAAFNADRMINRFWTYPRHLRRRIGGGILASPGCIRSGWPARMK